MHSLSIQASSLSPDGASIPWRDRRYTIDVRLNMISSDDRRGEDNAQERRPLTSDDLNDIAHVVATRRGDPDAFAHIVKTYSGRVFAQLLRMVRNREEAEDLTQETFVRAYRQLGRYDESHPFRNWLYTIAANVGLNAIRTQTRRNRLIQSEGVAAADRAEQSQSPKPLREAIQSEQHDRLGQAFESLTETSAVLVHLVYREEMTVREAADIVGMTEGAAKVALHRARKALREWFMGDGK